MSWFRHLPHRRDTAKTRPHPAVNDRLREEIEQNRRKLEQHRQQAEKEAEDGKLH